MPDRRKFLQTAAALSAAPLAARAAFSGDESGAIFATRLRFDAFVYDTRHAEARVFGARADQSGVPSHGFAGDITWLYQRELRRRWRGRAGAIAGLSERPALFLLEELGFEHGLSVVYQGEHDVKSAAQIGHRLLRGGTARLRAELDTSARHWPMVLADALLAAPRTTERNFGPTESAMASHLGEIDKLYSWIIAPRSAA